MVGNRQRFRAVAAVYYLAVVVGATVAIASRASAWHVAPFFAVFFCGTGGMVYLLLQWRRTGRLFERNWLIASFGSWLVAVLVGSGSHDSDYVIACLALVIGIVGAVTVFFRQRRELRG